jgi:L-lactate dehydrogenase complex protein LldG
MEDSTSKEKLLKKIRSALMNNTIETKDYAVDFDSSITPAAEDSMEIQFAKSFTQSGGKFVFCIDESEFIENLQYIISENEWTQLYCTEPGIQALLKKDNINLVGEESDLSTVKVAITSCEQLVGKTGSIMVSSQQSTMRVLPFSAQTHIVLAHTSQICSETKDSLSFLKQKYGNTLPTNFTFIRGNTLLSDNKSDKENLKDVFVFLIDDSVS